MRVYPHRGKMGGMNETHAKQATVTTIDGQVHEGVLPAEAALASAWVVPQRYSASERREVGLAPLTPFKAERLTDRQLAEETYRVLYELHQRRGRVLVPADGVSEFERGVREGAHNAVAYFRDENGHSTIDEHLGDSLDRIEAQAVSETLADEAQIAARR